MNGEEIVILVWLALVVVPLGTSAIGDRLK